MYYVSSINTKGNILVITKDDFILFSFVDQMKEQEIKIEFEDAYYFSMNGLVKYLNNCQNISCLIKSIVGQ